ncbi:protein disulfide-isomerase A6 [Entomortierella parvispora]|uniref:protein disulfide-isomerase n=1 Tax=Entomortierella parvispora TaxID=205924 RepID=A0A9P3M058_9FUNG|nr:protein disulfide-isomerase A6 [Entomortierella parvispora]
MKHSLASIALGALLLSQSALAGLYSSNDKVIEVTSSTFDSEVMDANHLVMVEFYAPWCGHCKNLAPHYKAAAQNLHGIVKMVAIDCDEDKNRPTCSRYGIQGFPTIKVFPANRKGTKGVKYPEDYQGRREAKDIVDYLVKKIPNDIQLVTANPSSDKIINIDELATNQDKPRAVLFTKKTASSNMYKGLATDMKDRMIVGEFRTPSDAVLKKYNVESLPALVVFPKGSEEPVAYTGEMKRDPLSDFLNEHAEPSSSKGGKNSKRSSTNNDSNNSKPKPAVVEFDPNITKIENQVELKLECLDKSVGSCLIAFLVHEEEFEESTAAHEQNMKTLQQVKKATHDAGKAIHVIWMDALDKSVVKFMNQFQISSDIPGLLLINPGKKAFVPFVGYGFDVEGIQSWLADSTTKPKRAFPYSFEPHLAPKQAPKVEVKEKVTEIKEEVKEEKKENIKDEL